MYRCLECGRDFVHVKFTYDEFGRQIEVCPSCGGATTEFEKCCGTCNFANDYVCDSAGYEMEEVVLKSWQIYCTKLKNVMCVDDEGCKYYENDI